MSEHKREISAGATLGILAVLVLAGGLGYVLHPQGISIGTSTEGTITSQTFTGPLTATVQFMCCGSVTIPAETSFVRNITIPNELGTHITGNFTVSSPQRSLIKIRIVRANQTATMVMKVATDLYDSGQLTSGSFNISVPAGTYSIIISNTFDTVPKVVFVNAWWTYCVTVPC